MTAETDRPLSASGLSPGHVTQYLYLSFSSGLHVSFPDMLDNNKLNQSSKSCCIPGVTVGKDLVT